MGTPAQWVQLLISTTSTLPWVFSANACILCSAVEGNTFNQSESSTWEDHLSYPLVDVGNPSVISPSDSGDFGLDTFVLGSQGAQLPNISLPGQLMSIITSPNLDVGVWGIAPSSTELGQAAGNQSFPSILSTLKNGSHVPSLSWGYTAGAYHRNLTTGSLTLGGYDGSRFGAHNTTFEFTKNDLFKLTVGIQSIEVSIGSVPPTRAIVGDQILSFLDPSTSFIWLNESLCESIASTLNLTYNAELDLYTIEDNVRRTHLADGVNVTFVLTNNLVDTSQTINITLPYNAFDLNLTAGYVTPGSATLSGNISYFPIHRAENPDQYILGRTFFQEAYVIADYERSQFSVHQAIFPEDTTATNLQVIPPLVNPNVLSNSTGSAIPTKPPSSSPTGDPSTSSLNVKVIVPIVIGVCAAILGFTLGILLVRKLRRSKAARSPDLPEQTIAELHEDELILHGELAAIERELPQLHGEALQGELEGTRTLQELRGEEAAQEIGLSCQPSSAL